MLLSKSILLSIALGCLSALATPNGPGGSDAENARVSVNTIRTNNNNHPVTKTVTTVLFTTTIVSITETIPCTRTGVHSPIAPASSVKSKRFAAPLTRTWTTRPKSTDKPWTARPNANPTTITKTHTLTAATTDVVFFSIYGNCSTPTTTNTETATPTETGCSTGYTPQVLIFDDIINSSLDEPILIPKEDPFIYKKFAFTDGWAINNCEKASDPADGTCNPDTIEGSQFLSLYSKKGATHPKFRRIIFDITNDFTDFEFTGFYVSTPPVNATANSIVYCGWIVADQDNDAQPTWCHTVHLEGEAPFLNKVTLPITKKNLAFIEFSAVEGYLNIEFDGQAGSRAKGIDSVDFWLDNIEVCVPEITIS